MTTQALTLPRDDVLPAWRAAVLAYRANIRYAAYAALREVLPDMPEAQLSPRSQQRATVLGLQ